MSGFDGNTIAVYSRANDNMFIKSISLKDAFESLANEETLEVFSYNPHNLKREWVSLLKFTSSISDDWIEFDIEGLCDRNNWTKFKITPNQILPILRDNRVIDIQAREIIKYDKLLFDASLYTMCEYDISKILTLTVKNINHEKYTDNCYSIKLVSNENPYFVLANGLIAHV